MQENVRGKMSAGNRPREKIRRKNPQKVMAGSSLEGA